jgi:quinol monooxygenase YgiN
MYAVTVRFEIFSDHMQFFLPLMHGNARASVAEEAGCQQFDVCTDDASPNSVFLYELYDDKAAFQSHLKSGHFVKFDAETSGMIASKEVTTFSKVLR